MCYIISVLQTYTPNVLCHYAATLDEKGKVVLVMLDLSSAFDTINHDILMNRLQHSVGITDAALSWLCSYITERYQRVAVDSATSVDCAMKCGVPQGSVLGPLLYCIYTRPIGDIVAIVMLTTHKHIYANHGSNYKDRTMFDGGD